MSAIIARFSRSISKCDFGCTEAVNLWECAAMKEGMTVKKATVFISHITEEKEIAQALKQVIESAFLGLIDVFVSSDADSIRLGGKWLLSLTTALKCCKIEILLASPTSVKRPWVNSEAGAGWVRDIPVIPLCHSGMTLETLPTPLSELQGAIATDPDQLRKLVPILA